MLPQSRLGQLLDVVHHAVQIPLRIDLGASSVVQASQTLVVAKVAKHRLHRTKALAVQLPASGGSQWLGACAHWGGSRLWAWARTE